MAIIIAYFSSLAPVCGLAVWPVGGRVRQKIIVGGSSATENAPLLARGNDPSRTMVTSFADCLSIFSPSYHTVFEERSTETIVYKKQVENKK
eukprot:scaffold1147_cov172-Amphora_coffeaeformis.AAC.1